MKKFAIVMGFFLVVGYVAALVIELDPQERRPGLNLVGELAADQGTDWGFLEGRNKIYVQMRTWYGLPHSITTTSWVVGGELYVPCGRCSTKYWPNHVAADNRVRLKVGDQIYARRAVRITQEPELRRVMQVPEDEPTPADVWVYRMEQSD